MNLENMTAPQKRAVLSDSKKIFAIAGPGSGKTTVLAARIQRLHKRPHPDGDRLCVLTYTNAAARNIEERAGGIVCNYAGTLHGFCLRMLRDYCGDFGYGDRTSVLDEESAKDLLTAKMATAGCKESIKKVWELKCQGRPKRKPAMPFTRAEIAVLAYMDELRDSGLLDFDMILTEFLRLLRNYNVLAEKIGVRFDNLLVDEIQDFAAIDWAICNELPIANKFFVGDPDQCQPPETRVRLADGITECPISMLKKGDAIMSYERHGQVLLKNGCVGEISERNYVGNMFTVTAGGKISRATANHRWLVKWRSGEQRRETLWCTYIMRLGDHFRIGKTKMFRSDGTSNGAGYVIGAALRMNQEKADALWILSVHKTQQAAFVQEEILAATYGLPQACFRASFASPHFDQESLDEIFASVPNQMRNAMRCLQDHGRELAYPLLDRSAPRTRRTVMEVRSCNLIPEVMFVPLCPDVVTSENRHAEWAAIAVSFQHYSGPVYSLDVPKYHKYVADGLVTCNCIFGFRGGAVQLAVAYARRNDVEVIHLGANFRCSEETCKVANRLIARNTGRIEKETFPGGHAPKGQVDVVFSPYSTESAEVEGIVDMVMHYYTENDGTTAILARTNAIANAFRDALQQKDILIEEAPKSEMPADWPRARALLEFLAQPENDTLAYFYLVARQQAMGSTPGEARKFASDLRIEARAQGVSINARCFNVRTTVSESIAQHVGKFIDTERLCKETVAIVTQMARDLPPRSTLLDLAVEAAGREKPPQPKPTDGVTVTTIHDAKGREWDQVYLVGMEDEVIPGHSDKADVEEERRLFFVALTRSRGDVWISHSATRRAQWGYRPVQPRTPSRFIREALDL